MTFFHKRILPVIMLGALLLFAIVPWIVEARTGQHMPLPAFVMPAVIAVIFIVVFKKLIFDLVDEVWDAGDALVIRNKGREDWIDLADIMNVSYSPFINPPRVTLMLRRPSVFGEQISFAAPARLVPFSTSPIINELIRRVDAARGYAR